MKAILMGTRVWPTKDKLNGDKVDIAKNQYTELTLINLESGDVELYNVESETFGSWEVAKEDFSRLKESQECKVLQFDTQTKFGKIKLSDCEGTTEVVKLVSSEAE